MLTIGINVFKYTVLYSSTLMVYFYSSKKILFSSRINNTFDTKKKSYVYFLICKNYCI